MSFEALGLTREVLTPGEPPVPRTVFADVSLRVAPGEALFVVGTPLVVAALACARALTRSGAQAPAARASRCCCARSRGSTA